MSSRRADYTLILADTDEDPVREQAYLRLLGARHVDGLILAPAGDAYPYLDTLMRTSTALVFLDRFVPGPPVPAVLLDNVAGGTHGHRSTWWQSGIDASGVIAGRAGISTTSERLAGYRLGLEAAGIDYDPRLVADGRSRVDDACQATAGLLELEPRPTALLACNNLMTIGTVMAIHQHGLEVPGDIAVVGFDDASWADTFRPRLTTVAQPTYEFGRAAAELLMRRIESPGAPAPARILLPGRLIIRESSGVTPSTADEGPPGQGSAITSSRSVRSAS